MLRAHYLSKDIVMGAVIEGREVKLQLVFLFKMQQQRNAQIFAKIERQKLDSFPKDAHNLRVHERRKEDR